MSCRQLHLNVHLSLTLPRQPHDIDPPMPCKMRFFGALTKVLRWIPTLWFNRRKGPSDAAQCGRPVRATSAAEDEASLYYIILYYIILYYIILYYIILYYIILYYIILYYTILYYTILYYIISLLKPRPTSEDEASKAAKAFLSATVPAGDSSSSAHTSNLSCRQSECFAQDNWSDSRWLRCLCQDRELRLERTGRHQCSQRDRNQLLQPSNQLPLKQVLPCLTGPSSTCTAAARTVPNTTSPAKSVVQSESPKDHLRKTKMTSHVELAGWRRQEAAAQGHDEDTVHRGMLGGTALSVQLKRTAPGFANHWPPDQATLSLASSKVHELFSFESQ